MRTEVRFPENIGEKIKKMATEQKRSFNSQIIFILEQFIKDYEKVNGEIKLL